MSGQYDANLGSAIYKGLKNAGNGAVYGIAGAAIRTGQAGLNSAITNVISGAAGAISGATGVDTAIDTPGVGGGAYGRGPGIHVMGRDGQGYYESDIDGSTRVVVNAGSKAAEMQQYIQATKDANQGIAGAREAAIAIVRQHFTTTDAQGNTRVDFPNQTYTTGIPSSPLIRSGTKVYPTPEQAFEAASQHFASVGVGRAQSATPVYAPPPAQPAPAPAAGTGAAPGATQVPSAPTAPAPAVTAPAAAPSAPAAPAAAPAASPEKTTRVITGLTTQDAPKEEAAWAARSKAIETFVQTLANIQGKDKEKDKKTIEQAINALPKDVDITKISYIVGDGTKNPDGSDKGEKVFVADRLKQFEITPRAPVVAGPSAPAQPAPAPADKPAPAPAAAAPAVKLHELPVPADNAPAAKAYSNIAKADMPKNLKQEQVDDLQKMLEQTGRKTGNTPHDGQFGEKSLAALKDACAKAGIADYKSVDFSNPKNADLIKLKESLAKEATAHAVKVVGVAAPAPEVVAAPAAAPAPQTAAAPAPAAPEITITADLIAPGTLTGASVLTGTPTAAPHLVDSGADRYSSYVNPDGTGTATPKERKDYIRDPDPASPAQLELARRIRESGRPLNEDVANALPSREAMINALTDIGHPRAVAEAQVASLVEPTGANRDALNAAMMGAAANRAGITPAEIAAAKAPAGTVITPFVPGAGTVVEQAARADVPAGVVGIVAGMDPQNPASLAAGAAALTAMKPQGLYVPPRQEQPITATTKAINPSEVGEHYLRDSSAAEKKIAGDKTREGLYVPPRQEQPIIAAPAVMPSQKDLNSMLFGAPTFTPSGASAPAAKPAPAPAPQLVSKAQQVESSVDVASLDFNNLPPQNLPSKPVVPGQGTTRMV